MKIILSLFFLLIIISIFSQNINSNTYPFSISSGESLELLVTPDTIIYSGVIVGDEFFSTVNENFIFNFAGQNFSNFILSPNGSLGLGLNTVLPGSSDLSSNINSYTIAPYWGSLLQTGSNQYVFTEILGAFPNRKLVIDYNLTATLFSFQDIHFQIWLNESTNIIEFVYDSIPTNPNEYAIGLSVKLGSLQNVASLNTSLSVSNTSINYSINSSNNSNTAPIPSGTKFTFNPQMEAPLNLSFFDVNASCLSLSWIDNSTKEEFFDIYKSSDSINFNYLTD